MRYRLLGSLCLAVLLFGVGSAQAHERTFESVAQLQRAVDISSEPGDNELWIIGQVGSDKAHCIPGRKVRVVAVLQDGSTQLVDIAQTGESGSFVGRGDFTNAVAAVARMMREKVRGGRRHRHICGPARDRFS